MHALHWIQYNMQQHSGFQSGDQVVQQQHGFKESENQTDTHMQWPPG